MDSETEHFLASVSVTEGQSDVEIELDTAAIKTLISDLEQLLTPSDHVHYFSKQWGGFSLTIPTNLDGRTPVHHIKITKV